MKFLSNMILFFLIMTFFQQAYANCKNAGKFLTLGHVAIPGLLADCSKIEGLILEAETRLSKFKKYFKMPRMQVNFELRAENEDEIGSHFVPTLESQKINIRLLHDSSLNDQDSFKREVAILLHEYGHVMFHHNIQDDRANIHTLVKNYWDAQQRLETAREELVTAKEADYPFSFSPKVAHIPELKIKIKSLENQVKSLEHRWSKLRPISAKIDEVYSPMNELFADLISLIGMEELKWGEVFLGDSARSFMDSNNVLGTWELRGRKGPHPILAPVRLYLGQKMLGMATEERAQLAALVYDVLQSKITSWINAFEADYRGSFSPFTSPQSFNADIIETLNATLE